ncbi:MAG: hypothetical protein CMF55_02490 [Legionellales bacterium]|nr:hypothetical protein [Legionellales bacterium]
MLDLGVCPLSREYITADNFGNTRLIVVGDTVYPIIGDETWETFTQQCKQDPVTREAGDYAVLVIANLPPNLKSCLHTWLVQEGSKDIGEPTEPTDLARILLNDPDTDSSNNLGSEPLPHLKGKFRAYLHGKNFVCPNHMNRAQYDRASLRFKILASYYTFDAILTIRNDIKQAVTSNQFGGIANFCKLTIDGHQYSCSRRVKDIYTMIENNFSPTKRACDCYATTISRNETIRTKWRLTLLNDISRYIISNRPSNCSSRAANQLIDEIQKQVTTTLDGIDRLLEKVSLDILEVNDFSSWCLPKASEASSSNSQLNQYFQYMIDGKLQYGERSIGETLLKKIGSKTFRKTPEGQLLVTQAQTFFKNVRVDNKQPEVQSAIARLRNYRR